jgi:hypothetical protein
VNPARVSRRTCAQRPGHSLAPCRRFALLVAQDRERSRVLCASMEELHRVGPGAPSRVRRFALFPQPRARRDAWHNWNSSRRGTRAASEANRQCGPINHDLA